MIRSILSRPSSVAAVLCAAMAGGLAGCSVLATPDPVQLYRFGETATGATVERTRAPVDVTLRPLRFSPAARSERILGVTGVEAAYIGGARWLSPAETLFLDSLTATFAARAPRVRLIGQREVTPTGLTLDVEVSAFEARYAQPETAPTATVIVRVRLLNRDRTIRADQVFVSEQAASANRVSAIVAAFDAATRDVNGRIADWTDQQVG